MNANNTMHANTIIKRAIDNTPAEYFAKTCAMRAGKDPGRMGSYFRTMTAERVDSFVRDLVWEPYQHADVQAPAKAYIARSVLGGIVGVAGIGDVPANAKLIWDDGKGTGNVECIWVDPADDARRVDFVVMLVGPDDDGEPCVWTFHPGDPVRPSQVARKRSWGPSRIESMGYCGEDDLHGDPVTKAEAVRLGVTTVKLA